MSRSDDLAQVAYAERCRFLLASGITPSTWEQLQPGTRRMLALEAGAVAAAVRDRIRPLAEHWREAAEHLRESDPARSSHFYDCASELERLLDGDS